MAYDATWLETLTDEKYRVTFNHPGIIRCIDCDFNWATEKENEESGPRCSNIASYPTMPKDFGCKNGRVKRVAYEPFEEYNILDKMKCKLGYHKAVLIGQYQPSQNEILERCDCCGKYGLWNRYFSTEIWFKPEHKKKYLSKSFLEMIEKYNL